MRYTPITSFTIHTLRSSVIYGSIFKGTFIVHFMWLIVRKRVVELTCTTQRMRHISIRKRIVTITLCGRDTTAQSLALPTFDVYIFRETTTLSIYSLCYKCKLHSQTRNILSFRKFKFY